MVGWPKSLKSAEGVYTNNEYLSFEGRFPVGERGSWHSGIHIRCPDIYPMIEGWLAAYRIAGQHTPVVRIKRITNIEYNLLSGPEQQLYQPDTEKSGFYTSSYTLKDNLPPDLEKYRDEQYSNSFFLIRHRVRLPPQDAKPEEHLELFTLYTNIEPAEITNTEFGPPSVVKNESVIPFYERFKFKVVAEPHIEYPYANRGNGRIFPGSHCDLRYKDAATFICKFDNLNQEIDVSINDIEIINRPIYKPQTIGAAIYDVAMPQTDTKNEEARDEYKIATLLQKSSFQASFEFCYDGFVKVKVDPGEIDMSAIESGENPISQKGTEVIVFFSDLQNTQAGRGRLKENNSLCTERIKGIMVYNGPGKESNAFGILSGGEEFEMEEPGEFWDNLGKSEQYVPLKRTGNDETERKQYLYFRKHADSSAGEDIEAKVEHNIKYKLNSVEITDNGDPLDPGTLLGKPLKRPYGYKEYYDLVLLLDNIDFMKRPGNTRIDGYVFPQGTALYQPDGRDAASAPGFVEESASSHEMIIAEKSAIVRAGNGLPYAQFKYEGKTFYMLDMATGKYRANLLDWGKFFKILDTGKEEKKDKNIPDTLKDIADAVKDLWEKEKDKDGDILYDGNPDWHRETKLTEGPGTKRLKRGMVCCHPLEWDKALYIKDGQIEPKIRLRFGIPGTQEHKTRFINQVKAVDIWEGLKGKQIEGLNLEENSFWFAHPVYFINHLDRAGLLTEPRIRNLMRIQDEVVALECLKQGNKGIYPEVWDELPLSPRQTYCNHAVYLTIRAVDKNFTNFTDTKGGFPESSGYEDRNGGLRGSNYWCDVLEQQATTEIIRSLGEEEAQAKANEGYVVIGAWKNQAPGGSPHFATVRPGSDYDKIQGAMLANVGAGVNGIKRRSEGFDKPVNEIHWYYNPNQYFQYEPDEVLKYINYR